jgi:hypothetical protein
MFIVSEMVQFNLLIFLVYIDILKKFASVLQRNILDSPQKRQLTSDSSHSSSNYFKDSLGSILSREHLHVSTQVDSR